MLWILRRCACYMILGGGAEEEVGGALCGPGQSTYMPHGDGYSPLSLVLQGRRNHWTRHGYALF
jgi:hypothetical protein